MQTKRAPPLIIKQHRNMARVLARRIGPSSWQSLTVGHLREYIVECGVHLPHALKKSGLQSLLSSLAPGVSQEDITNAEGEGMESGAGEAVSDEKTA